MSEDFFRVWTRAELEEVERGDRPEGLIGMLKVAVSAKFLLLLMDYAGDRGDRVEAVKGYGDPKSLDLKFYKRDSTEDLTPMGDPMHDAYPYPECAAHGCSAHP